MELDVRRVVPAMRWVFGVGSVLVTAAGVQLFVLTDHTARYFAWTISPGLSAGFSRRLLLHGARSCFREREAS